MDVSGETYQKNFLNGKLSILSLADGNKERSKNRLILAELERVKLGKMKYLVSYLEILKQLKIQTQQT